MGREVGVRGAGSAGPAGAIPGLGRGAVAGWTLALIGGAGVIVGSALPWVRTGRRERSAFTVIRVVHDLDVIETALQRVAVSALLAVPVLVPMGVLLVATGYRRSAATALAVAAVVGLAAAGVGLRVSGTDLAGPIVTLIGALGALVGPLVALRSARPNRRRRPPAPSDPLDQGALP